MTGAPRFVAFSTMRPVTFVTFVQVAGPKRYA
jgi:hypothetical protein